MMNSEMSTNDALATLFTDAQLNWLGIVGVVLYLFAHYALSRRWCSSKAMWNRAARGLGLAGILTPLFLRWYLSSSMLVAAGLMLTIAGLYAFYIQRFRGI